MLFLLTGCAHKSGYSRFLDLDLNWKFVKHPPYGTMACLPDKDVMELRKVLIQCMSCKEKK